MNTLKILRLELRNFKGQRNLDLDFGGRSCTIYGDNATGKTTVYDAFSWLLFGVDSLGQSENRGAQTSHGLSYQKLGKELMTQDEIAVMDGGKCILQLRGVRPFFSDKYDLTKHPRYKYLSDADKKNVFDVERYMKRRPAIVKPDEPFEMYELKASDLETENDSTKRKEM